MRAPRSRPGRWRVIIAAVLVALLFVAVSVRRTAVDALLHRSEFPADTTWTGGAHAPGSIIAIHIDPETDATGVIDLTPPPPPLRPTPADTAALEPEETRPDTRPDLDLDDLLDQAAGPRGGSRSAAAAAVPPRPIEITWPETRQLKQCIGQSVNVRIRVSEEGRVKDAKIVPSGVLPACADAALAAARHIRFEPGRQGGVPVSMWTEIRIDFQRRD